MHFLVCVASRRQWVSHCEKAEPSHFLPLEQQQPVLRVQSPALLKYIKHSESLGVLPFFLSPPCVSYDKDKIKLFSEG